MSIDAHRLDGAVLALSGGVGGAKLALGLSHVLPPEQLVIVANTGDDFEHFGLAISPDVDTLLYTLCALSDEERGWGRRDESWNFMAALAGLGGETWFNLGDRDLAIHVVRSHRLRAGETLSAITDDLRRRLGIAARLLPMSDDPVRTRLETTEGRLDFQDYFVARRCAPAVRRIHFDGAAEARPAPLLMAALRHPGLRAVILCPSNPFISIEPILALPGVRAALADCPAPVISVSPIVGGKAVKGPTAKMMTELGLPSTASAASRRYDGLLDAVVIDHDDTGECDDLAAAHGAPVFATRTLMHSLADRIALATKVLEVADLIGRPSRVSAKGRE